MYVQVYGVAMASLLGPVLANIFGTDLEFTTVPSLENYLQHWKRFVDNVFVFFLPDKVGYIASQLNSSDVNIQLTYEMEEDNKLEFLDVMTIR